MKFILGLSLLALASMAEAATKIPVTWDCLLKDDVVTCNDIRDAFFSANDGFERVPAGPHLMSINLRKTPLANALLSKTEYKFIISAAQIQTEIAYQLDDHLSSMEKSEKILAELNKLMEAFKPVLQYESSGESKQSPFYIAPSISGSFKKQPGSSSGEGDIGFIANYSTERWRVVGWQFTDASTEKAEATAFTYALNVKVFTFNEGFGIVRSLTNHWDIAIRAERTDVSTDINGRDLGLPDSVLKNSANQTILKVGGEWLLHSSITEKTNGNLGVRYHVGLESNNYIDPQSFAQTKDNFAIHTVEVLASHHWTKFDLSTTGSVYASNFREKQLYGASLKGDVSYQVSSRLSVGMGVSANYDKNPVPSAAAGKLSFINLTSGAYQNDSLSYKGKFTLKYTFGNARLYNNEQRWKYSSSNN